MACFVIDDNGEHPVAFRAANVEDAMRQYRDFGGPDTIAEWEEVYESVPSSENIRLMEVTEDLYARADLGQWWEHATDGVLSTTAYRVFSADEVAARD